MKITDIKTFVCDAFRTNWTFVKVETDEGLHGWGEASLGTQEMALSGCVEDLKRLIIGRNPMEIERMCFEVCRDIYWKGGPVLTSAVSGIEMALWDITGKYFNAPVYALLGGKMRDRVKMYANAWFTGAREPAEFAAKARETVALGVKALKWDPFGKAHMTLSNEELEKSVETVGAVREAVGPHIDLLIECHGRFNPYTGAAIARELTPFKPMLLEEPCPPDNFDALAAVRAKSDIPVAAGERVYTKFGFNDLFNKNAVDIVQPDIFHAGGILESKKIAAMAEARHIPVSFHNPSGPVSNAAILQLAACTPNFLIHEIMLTDGSFRKDFSDEEVVFEDGFLRIPDKPGLGIEIHEEAVQKHPYKPRNLRHYTGNLTDIRPKEDTVYYFKGIQK
ncbi:MAG: D-galactonate dehydratase [Lentisphaerae bacterium ADurb.Bin242]|nr:MAG: D-galactonate dehydratase [Lentisphaerae bacterium ADurb.Bin242]